MVVEDEKDIRDILVTQLQGEGFSVVALEHCNKILSELEQHRPDLVLLDQVLPGRSGTDAVREIRNSGNFYKLPIIMVTGLTGEDDKVGALDVGADDYITKPFRPRELSARIKAVARRVESVSGKDDLLTVGELVIDIKAHKATLKGQEVALTLTEFKILVELLRQRGQVLSREQLRSRALGNLNVTDRTIDVHMASLRRKLEHMGDRIETVRGVGYRFG